MRFDEVGAIKASASSGRVAAPTTRRKPTPAARRRRSSWLAVVFAGLVVAGAVGGGILLTRKTSHPAATTCRVVAGAGVFTLDPEQALNATTIAAVGKRTSLADHAVTVALATALQESNLHNLTYGDRDSVGLFQQRPSQGWGTRAQVLDPRFASLAFYRALTKVSGWEKMAVADAAQAVQHSNAPGAYGQWESEARAIAQAATGEVLAGLACRFPTAAGRGSTLTALTSAANAELGLPALHAALPPTRGWMVASWLVGHAQPYRIRSITYAGRRWTPGQLEWSPASPTTDQVEVVS